MSKTSLAIFIFLLFALAKVVYLTPEDELKLLEAHHHLENAPYDTQTKVKEAYRKIASEPEVISPHVKH